MPRLVLTLRLVLPAVLIGLVIGLAFLEAPLKFQAPGITTALGLGIGRLVFFALELATAIIVLLVGVLLFARPRPGRASIVIWAVTAVILAVQSLVVRPPLNARSDVIIAGGDPGSSGLHYVYIATDVALLVALIVMLVVTARRSLAVRAE